LFVCIAASFTGLFNVGTIFLQNFETNIVKKDIPLVLEQIENKIVRRLEMVKETPKFRKR
jgi:hypothetical protein